ncbi:sigma-70 family RNA polymerase sigma factor [Aquimarina sp. 2201CG5-10]|uniref:RNA polymerase sigma factor n=1 Tax=Aquimarina callyspongiae TaxID=3098150 RepID=UPI002AB3AC5F|nr:sigma-70 family RNA polymerase sigma factor [Aquimarina sp. 2201CG5-10]MDY8137237.1 sigma-70 family RNA polymerase sigma factor [Aquimarina sp. 2201CG5-10]
MSRMNEEEIKNRIVSGDEIILKSFYHQHFSYIKSYISKQGGSKEDAEDIFQDALLLVYLKLRSNQDVINISVAAYFKGICKNLWRNHVRNERKWAMADILTDDFEDDQISITEEILNKNRKNLFNTYFSTLHGKTKQLWKLIFEEKSSKEIALETGYTEKYVRKKKHDTKKQLIHKISKDPIYQELVEYGS